MAKPEKVSAVAELKEQFENSDSALITEYRGLSVPQITELRKALGDSASYTVAKNTLVKRAANEASVEGLDELLSGPTAIAFVTGEVVDAAKALKNFAKDNKELVIKGGVLDGKAMSAEEINKLADLESRETLLAKLAGGLQASLSQAVYLFAAPLSQAARTVDALRAKVETEGPVSDAAPAADEATADVAEGGDEA